MHVSLEQAVTFNVENVNYEGTNGIKPLVTEFVT
jgi:hypothetical protein